MGPRCDHGEQLKSKAPTPGTAAHTAPAAGQRGLRRGSGGEAACAGGPGGLERREPATPAGGQSRGGPGGLRQRWLSMQHAPIIHANGTPVRGQRRDPRKQCRDTRLSPPGNRPTAGAPPSVGQQSDPNALRLSEGTRASSVGPGSRAQGLAAEQSGSWMRFRQEDHGLELGGAAVSQARLQLASKGQVQVVSGRRWANKEAGVPPTDGRRRCSVHFFGQSQVQQTTFICSHCHARRINVLTALITGCKPRRQERDDLKDIWTRKDDALNKHELAGPQAAWKQTGWTAWNRKEGPDPRPVWTVRPGCRTVV